MANTHLQDEEYSTTDNNRQMAHRIVTAEKLRWAIDSFHPFKAAGPDGIFPALLQWGLGLIQETLTDIMVA